MANRHLSLGSLLLSIILIFPILCFSEYSYGVDATTSPQTTQQTPLVGQTLFKTRNELKESKAKLESEIASVNQEVVSLERENADVLSGFKSFLFLLGIRWIQPVGIITVIIPTIWILLLLVMYRNIRKEHYLKLKPILMKLLIGFVVLAVLCLITGIAGASTTPSYQMPKKDLPGTLEFVRQSGSMETWRRVLQSLEEPNCNYVKIPPDVVAWISQNCSDAVFPNPIEGQGPHRLASIAAIYWSAGAKDKALEVLKPIADEEYTQRSFYVKSAYRTALCLFASKMESETTAKFAHKMMPMLNTTDLIWMANKIRGCCINVAHECLEKAKQEVENAEDVLLVAKTLVSFARSEDSREFITKHLQMTFNIEAMKAFLEFTKERGLPDIEQQILSKNIEWRNSPNELIRIAEIFRNMGYPPAVKRAVGKALEKEMNAVGLIEIASITIKWNLLDIAQTTLKKIIDVDGFDGAAMLFPDPMLIPVSFEKPVDQDPSVGVTLGIISEKLGDLKAAESDYTEFLNLELYNGFMCIGSSQNINFTNFFYPYRFFIAQKNTKLIELLDPVGRALEQQQISELKLKMEKEIESLKSYLGELKSRLITLKFKIFFRRSFVVLYTIFSLIIIVAFVIAQVVAVQRMLEWLKPVDHLKILGGFLKLIELEGFIIGATIVFAPVGFGIILSSQFFMSILLAEAQAFRLSEHQRTGRGQEWVKLPLTYRD